MADTSPFILTGPDTSLPNSRTLDTALGLTLEDTGAGGSITIAPSGNLKTLAEFTTQTDFISYNTIDKIIPGSIADGTGIETVRSAPAVVTVNVKPNTTHQLTEVQVGGVTTVLGRSILNFTATGSASVSVTEDPLNSRANININSTVAASTDATYIIQKTDSGLPNAQVLGDLTNGLLKLSVTDISGGVISIAEPDIDYQAASENLSSLSTVTHDIGDLIVGAGIALFTNLPAGASNTVLTAHGPGNELTWEPPVSGTGITTEVLGHGHLGQTLETNHYYIANNNVQQPFSLPDPNTTPASPGDFYKIIGAGSGGWTLTQYTGQSIAVGSIATTQGTSGSISSVLPEDSIDIYCVNPSSFVAHVTSGQVNVA